MASTRIATGPLQGFDALAGGVHQSRVGGELQLRVACFHRAERLALGEEVPRDPHDHGGKPARVAAEIDDDAAAALR